MKRQASTFANMPLRAILTPGIRTLIHGRLRFATRNRRHCDQGSRRPTHGAFHASHHRMRRPRWCGLPEHGRGAFQRSVEASFLITAQRLGPQSCAPASSRSEVQGRRWSAAGFRGEDLKVRLDP